MKNKSSTDGKKRREALRGFLRALYQVSISPGVCPFCTPGHKTGRGFRAILTADLEGAIPARPEEVG
jgi:hypothetical protein